MIYRAVDVISRAKVRRNEVGPHDSYLQAKRNNAEQSATDAGHASGILVLEYYIAECCQ